MQSMEQDIKNQLKNWGKLIRKYQKPDTKKAVWQMLNTFLPFLAIWVLMYISMDYSYWITFGLGFINAFLLVRIFIIQHDCGHQSFLKSRRWNNVVGTFCSFFSTIPFEYWANIHNYHHTHTGKLEHRDIGDIDFLTFEEYRKRSKWGRFKYRVFRNPFVLFGFVPVYYMTVSNRIPSISVRRLGSMEWPKMTRERISQVINNVALAAVYISLGYFLGWGRFFLIQLQIVLVFMMIAFWFFYVQHQHEETYNRWQKNWDYLLAAIRGATYYKLPKLFMWLTGNIGFHHIHHLSSKIPNYNLEKCAKENPILQKFATVMTFRESIPLIFNKLWDEETKRMITFKEFYRLEQMRFG